jgi:DNA-binding GntR family transcriptional regulator
VTIKPLEYSNLSAQAYASLREELIAGNFRPGERLVMQDLAERLGTSVTPVREACLRLVSEQGLEIRSGRFITVPDLDLGRYLEIRVIRLSLEGLAAELATKHAQSPDIRRLTEIQRRFEKAAFGGDAKTAIDMNRHFHFGVYRLSKMNMLVAQIESMWVSMGPILKVYHEQIMTEYRGATEHVHVIDCLARGDGSGARAALERDIVRGGEGILNHLSSYRDTATA